MDKNTQDAYEEFRSALEAVGAGLPTFLELTMGMLQGGAPQIALALMGNMRDIITEMPAGAETPYHELIACSYSRTFCDPMYVGVHGGDAEKLKGTDVAGLLRSVAEGLRHLAASDNPEQLQMALEAPTDNPH